MLSALLREARPKQWVKNILVFAAPGALGVLGHWTSLAPTLVMFGAFCLTASGTYFLNDVQDVANDRLHPKKSRRPIAAGEIPIPLARLVAAALLVVGPLLAATTRPAAGVIVAMYAITTISYSMGLKNIVLLDLVIVASGFVLRAVAGAVGTDTHMSKWFVLCTSFGSLFIIAGKRFGEMQEMGQDAGLTRAALKDYSETFLRMLVIVACGATLLAYCLWAFESAEALSTNFRYFELSIVPMALSVFRYLMVIEQGKASAPEDVFATDRAIQMYGAVWLIVYGLGIYAS